MGICPYVGEEFCPGLFSLFLEHQHYTRLWKVGNVVHPYPVGTVHSPVGTQSVREVGIMGAWAGWGVQEGSPRKEHHLFNNMDPTPRLLCAGLYTVCACQSPGPCPTASRHWRPKEEVVACPKGSWTDEGTRSLTGRGGHTGKGVKLCVEGSCSSSKPKGRLCG